MLKSLGMAAAAVMLAGCVYTPTPGPSVAPYPGGLTVNDNGYMAYYSTKAYPIVDCKTDMTWRCEDRLEHDPVFCAAWEATGRCGDSATVSDFSEEIIPPPPGGRNWLFVF